MPAKRSRPAAAHDSSKQRVATMGVITTGIEDTVTLRDCSDEQLLAETRRRQAVHEADGGGARGGGGALASFWNEAAHIVEEDKVKRRYELGGLIGEGAFGSVRCATAATACMAAAVAATAANVSVAAALPPPLVALRLHCCHVAAWPPVRPRNPAVLQVRLATDRVTQVQYALKEVDLAGSGGGLDGGMAAQQEVAVMRKLRHKGLVNLVETFQSPKSIWLVWLPPPHPPARSVCAQVEPSECAGSTNEWVGADAGVLPGRRVD